MKEIAPHERMLKYQLVFIPVYHIRNSKLPDKVTNVI